MKIKRGEIYYANLFTGIGAEQGGIRPVLVLQNDTGNTHSSTTIIAPITTRPKGAHLPVHCELPCARTGLRENSVVLLEQLRVIDKSRLSTRIGRIDETMLNTINNALSISVGLREVV